MNITGRRAGDQLIFTGRRAGDQCTFTGRRAGEPAHLHWETCWGPAHLHWETCWNQLIFTGRRAGDQPTFTGRHAGDQLIFTGRRAGNQPTFWQAVKTQQLNSSSNWNWDVNHCYRRHLRRRPLRLPHPHHLHSPDTTPPSPRSTLYTPVIHNFNMAYWYQTADERHGNTPPR